MHRWDAQPPAVLDAGSGRVQFPFTGSDGRTILAPHKPLPNRPGSCSVPAVTAITRPAAGATSNAVSPSQCPQPSPQPNQRATPQQSLSQTWPTVAKAVPTAQRSSFAEVSSIALRPAEPSPVLSAAALPPPPLPTPQLRPTRTNGSSPIQEMIATGVRRQQDKSVLNRAPSTSTVPTALSPLYEDGQVYASAPSPLPLEPDLVLEAAMNNENYAGYGLYSPASTIDMLPAGAGYLQAPARFEIFTPGYTASSALDTPTPFPTSDGGTGGCGNRGGAYIYGGPAHERSTANSGRSKNKRGSGTDDLFDRLDANAQGLITRSEAKQR